MAQLAEVVSYHWGDQFSNPSLIYGEACPIVYLID